MSYTQKTHMERNENLIYDYDRAHKWKAETSKGTQKMIIWRPLKQIIKRRFFYEDKSRHAIDKIN